MKQISFIAALVLIAAGSNAQKLQESAVPTEVKSAFAKKFPNARAVKWSKETATEFEAEFKNGSMEQAANFDATGNWVVTETEIKKSDLPADVVKAITKDFPGYKITEVEKVEKPDHTELFEAKVEKGEKTYVVQVSQQGKILKKEEEKEEKDKD
jgi:hypothetical protein